MRMREGHGCTPTLSHMWSPEEDIRPYYLKTKSLSGAGARLGVMGDISSLHALQCGGAQPHPTFYPGSGIQTWVFRLAK